MHAWPLKKILTDRGPFISYQLTFDVLYTGPSYTCMPSVIMIELSFNFLLMVIIATYWCDLQIEIDSVTADGISIIMLLIKPVKYEFQAA